MQFEQLAHPLALDAELRADLREGQPLDRAQTEHLQLTLGLDVTAAGGERCQAAAVKLADQLVQLDAATDALELSSGATPGTSAGWTFTAPAGTTITGLTYERYIGHQFDGFNDWSPALRKC